MISQKIKNSFNARSDFFLAKIINGAIEYSEECSIKMDDWIRAREKI